MKDYVDDKEEVGLIPVIGLAVPEIASTDSHDTCPACVREGPAPGGPTTVYKLSESRVIGNGRSTSANHVSRKIS